MYTPQEFSAPGFQGHQKPELRFVPSALFQGSSKFAHCTESGASVHTHRQMASGETCWPLKRFQAGYPSSLVAGVCAQRSWDRWRTPRLPRPNPVDSAASPPAQQRAATWLSSNRPPPEVSQQQAPGGSPCFLLFQDCQGPGSLGENWGAKRTPGQNLKQTYFLCLEGSWSVGGFEWFL